MAGKTYWVKDGGGNDFLFGLSKTAMEGGEMAVSSNGDGIPKDGQDDRIVEKHRRPGDGREGSVSVKRHGGYKVRTRVYDGGDGGGNAGGGGNGGGGGSGRDTSKRARIDDLDNEDEYNSLVRPQGEPLGSARKRMFGMATATRNVGFGRIEEIVPNGKGAVAAGSNSDAKRFKLASVSVGDDDVYNRDDRERESTPHPPVKIAEDEYKTKNGVDRAAERGTAIVNLRKIYGELNGLNDDALKYASDYSSSIDILSRAKEGNPYIKYAVLVAMNMREHPDTYVAKTDTNQFIQAHKKQIDETNRRIRSIAKTTPLLTREHVFDGIQLQILAQGESNDAGGFGSARLGAVFEENASELPKIYDKPEMIVPSTSNGAPHGDDEDDDSDARRKNIVVKRYDINTDNEYVKEQLSVLIAEVLDNINLVRSAEQTLLIQNRQSYEELITIGLRVKTEDLVEIGLRRIGRIVYQRDRNGGAGVGGGMGTEYYLENDIISEMCSSLLQNSTARNILASTLTAKMIRDQIDIRATSQTQMKRNDILLRYESSITALAEFLSTSPIVRKLSVSDSYEQDGGPGDFFHGGIGRIENTERLSHSDVANIIKNLTKGGH